MAILRPGGRVVAVEMVPDTGSDDWFPFFLDLQILVCPTGRLRLTRVVRTESVFSLIEGVAV